MTTGERIRRLREGQAHTLSQQGLCNRVSERNIPGVKLSPAFLSRIEKGERRPSPRVLDAIAKVLGVQAGYLETGENHWTVIGVYLPGGAWSEEQETFADHWTTPSWVEAMNGSRKDRPTADIIGVIEGQHQLLLPGDE